MPRPPNSRGLLWAIVALAVSSGSQKASAQLVYETGTASSAPGTVAPAAPTLGTTDTPPLFPSTGLGFAGAPATYTGTLPAAFGGTLPLVTPTAGRTLLPGLQSGAAPIQAGNDRAPALLLLPSIGLTQGFDDNPRQSRSTRADSVTGVTPSLVVSADTPRLQALASASLSYLKYARTADQDNLTINGTAYGLATVLPEHLYVDGRAAVAQVSPTGNIGFVNPALGTLAQPTSIVTTAVTPIVRQDLGDLGALDFRYTHASVSSGSVFSTASAPSASLASIQSDQANLSVAFGRGNGLINSRATIQAANISSQSDAASTQVRAFDDLQYRITPGVAVTARAGYENLRYPVSGLAFVGPILVGGTELDPTPTTALKVQYGRQDGSWGFSGAVRQLITPRTVLLASYQHGLGSQQEGFVTNLERSRMDVYGNIVDAETFLPLSLANPEIGYSQTGVFRTEQARLALEHEFETDSVRLFAFYEKQTALSSNGANDRARGVELSWFRSMTPRLTGAMSVGYALHVGGKTLSSGLTFVYAVAASIDGTLSYQFQRTDSTPSVNSYTRNTLVAGIRASF